MQLNIFHHLINDEIINAILNGEDLQSRFPALIEFAEEQAVTDEPLKEYVVSKLSDDNNVFSRILASDGKIGESLKNAVLSDLKIILDKTEKNLNIDYTPSGNPSRFSDSYKSSVEKMVYEKNANQFYSLLEKHLRILGNGIFARYIAFSLSKDGSLLGIDDPEPVPFDSLVGIDHIIKILKDNTELFLSGERANNVLLFGDRGTGKSSSVKALLHEYYDRGLRIIELPKNAIGQIPNMFKLLRDKPQKFILFLDDLSFEKHEAEYRTLKVSMEGQLGKMPQNVLIFATSNRRHLIKENWKDREGGDIHANDNMQEMLSLSERFGISLVFQSPNQKEYLELVRLLLEKRGIAITPEIEKQAVAWQMHYGGRTPRCASQFVQAYKED
ncbi:MAG: ATP-binding protein [Clostridia bacterium]|nr:ATP-binding protein [Clostridia bacterium]